MSNGMDFNQDFGGDFSSGIAAPKTEDYTEEE